MNQKRGARLLKQLSTELTRLLGEDLDQVLLYGSDARGEAHLDSDLDILIVVRGKGLCRSDPEDLALDCPFIIEK